jgi:FtsP/CotA-like multicopper oxidase with cupredoxin domain
MTRQSIRRLCLLAVFVIGSGTLRLAAQSAAAISTNDNRTPAGQIQNGVLTIHLELAEGQWHPGSEQGEAVRIYAFGEAGQPLQIPGPLIRVPQGTEIQASVHNSLPVAATVHGLHQRPGEEKDSLVVQPGVTKEVRFQAGDAGTYYYWASTTGDPIATRKTMDSELAGAYVIDPPGAVPNDRVFVLGVWFWPGYRQLVRDPNYREIATINGKLWPYTERFTFHLGETVRWRWVNPTPTGHAMHLHGFYYNVDAVGNGERDKRFSDAERLRVVTHHDNRGETFDMSFAPDRPGRWLMHCHMLEHMTPMWHPILSEPVSGHAHGSEPDDAGMVGMVLGITVLDDKPAAPPPVWKAERKLQLIIEERKNGRPLYALTVLDAAPAPPPSQPPAAAPLLGPPIVLTRGQPVEIEVVNHIQEPTAIHWHGIELESYYDGVPGWGGAGKQITPVIPPGKSFVARMTPPRAGTFIYHTHYHDVGQLTNGIYGPLIVMPPGQSYDPTYDKTFVIAMGTYEPFGDMLVINGSPQLRQMALKTHTKYRLRFINITPDEPGIQLRLLRARVPVEWRLLAKDGYDAPAEQAVKKPADILFAVGETIDYEYEAEKPEELTIDVFHPRPRSHATQTLTFFDEIPK